MRIERAGEAIASIEAEIARLEERGDALDARAAVA